MSVVIVAAVRLPGGVALMAGVLFVALVTCMFTSAAVCRLRSLMMLVSMVRGLITHACIPSKFDGQRTARLRVWLSSRPICLCMLVHIGRKRKIKNRLMATIVITRPHAP
jgi:hypothetical protein